MRIYITQRQHEVLSAIADDEKAHGSASIVRIGQTQDKATNTVRSQAAELFARGLIVLAEGSRSSIWRTTPFGRKVLRGYDVLMAYMLREGSERGKE